MKKHYVFMLFGLVGGGKSYVSQWLAPHTKSIHLRADDLRVEMFGGDRLELHRPENQKLVNNATNYTFRQILKSGQVSIILDANFNPRHLRERIAAQAREYDATPIVVWVKVPEDVAEARTVSREQSGGHAMFEPGVVQKMAKRMQPPTADEMVIVIDGMQTAIEQQASFDRQFAQLQEHQEQGN